MKLGTMRWGVAVYVCFFLSIGLSPLWGQWGHISGIVTDQDGDFIEGALIKIQSMSGRRKPKEVKTDKRGEFYCGNVPTTGKYVVTGSKEGYQSMEVSPVRPTRASEQSFAAENPKALGRANLILYKISDASYKAAKEQEKLKKRKEANADVEELVNRGMTHHTRGSYQKALRTFDRALEKLDSFGLLMEESDLDRGNIWANKGSAYFKMKRYDMAAQSYKQAIQFSSDKPSFYQNLGIVYTEMGDGEQAKAMYDKASVAGATVEATNYYNMAVGYINDRKSSEAVEMLNKALEIDPDHSETHYQFGLLWLGRNKLKEGVTHLKKYLVLAPEGPNAALAKGIVDELGE